MTGIALALAVAAAGGAGAALRHLVDELVPARGHVPSALLVINATGSFALGVLVSVTADTTWHTVVGTGLLGGYTTFSAASLDAALRWVDGERASGARSAALMLAVCVAAAFAGVSVGG
ncbi:CrcB family protein [Aeromicrobium sp. Leaf350]|uniref:fluoride efflux transporter FluC n=1 Tax=Aeromicrobium sp. Leaf350 TaxID=2876565 RepID=UPI001E5CCFE5|nr:CrcB family protein [Aeromicrobium sp. Leaf350]